jgi:hypothetical protein
MTAQLVPDQAFAGDLPLAFRPGGIYPKQTSAAESVSTLP